MTLYVQYAVESVNRYYKMSKKKREWMSEQEAAVLLRVSIATIGRWRRAGDGPAYYQLGGCTSPIRYRASDIAAFVESQRHGGAITKE